MFRAFALPLPSSGGPALPADSRAAAQHVLEEIGLGRAWCGFRAIASAAEFSISGIGERERQAFAGDSLRVNLPPWAPKEIELRVRGPAVLLDDARSVRLEKPGAVQVEGWARVRGMPFDGGWKP